MSSPSSVSYYRKKIHEDIRSILRDNKAVMLPLFGPNEERVITRTRSEAESAEMPLEDISFSDVSISVSEEADAGYPEMADDIPSMSRTGFFIRNVHNLRLEHVEVSGQIGDAFDIAECEDVTTIE